jgi:hypothetical protein
MAITMAVDVRKVCMSRRWKTEQVTFRIHVHTPARFALLMPRNLTILLYDQSVQKVFSTSFWLQKSIASKPCIKIDRMSNQRKDEFVSGKFWIQSFWGGHGNPWLMPKGRVCPEICFCRPVEIPTAITCKSLTVCSRIMDHLKAERVGYCNGIRSFQSFG